MRGKTTLVVSHHPQVLADADRVILLEKGRITAEGGLPGPGREGSGPGTIPTEGRVRADSPYRYEFPGPTIRSREQENPVSSAGRIAEIEGKAGFTAGSASGFACPTHVLIASFTGGPARASASGAADREATNAVIGPGSAGVTRICTIASRTSFDSATSLAFSC